VATLVSDNIQMLYFRQQVDLLLSERHNRTTGVEGDSLDGYNLYNKAGSLDSSARLVTVFEED
jgi:hypothetical protein